MPFVSTSQDSSPTGICSRLPQVDLWEPYDGRLSRTVLREPGGEIPPGYSPGPDLIRSSCASKFLFDPDARPPRFGPTTRIIRQRTGPIAREVRRPGEMRQGP